LHEAAKSSKMTLIAYVGSSTFQSIPRIKLLADTEDDRVNVIRAYYETAMNAHNKL